jgi:glycosyltransferase involved in cell wall biosynthesis
MSPRRLRAVKSPQSPRPRVVYVAFYFPPTRASGVYRSRATANHLAAAGWDVTVITPQREFFTHYINSFDPSLEATVRGDVQVDRVRFPGRAWEPDVRRYTWLRANLPSVSKALSTKLENAVFPEHYSPWIPRVVRRIRELHKRAPVDLVLATGNPFSAFAAAWAANRLTGVPYVVDYRDSWTLDLFRDEPAFPPGHPAWRWEQRILRGASRIVFVNDPLREWHAERYPQDAERMLVVQNGYEPEILGELPPARPVLHGAALVEGTERPLKFGYMGTLTQHVPVEPFLDGWRLARSEDPELGAASMHVFGHLGFFPASASTLRAKLPRDGEDGVHYEGSVPKAEVGRAYAGLDVLVLLLAGGRYVTSGKVYEYMASGRPIVSVHDPSSAASGVLTGYPLWFPVRDVTGEEVARVLKEAAAAARVADPARAAAARTHAGEFTRDGQLADFERELRRLTGRQIEGPGHDVGDDRSLAAHLEVARA